MKHNNFMKINVAWANVTPALKCQFLVEMQQKLEQDTSLKFPV